MKTNKILLQDVARILTGVQITKKEIERLKINPTHHFLDIKNIQEVGIIYSPEKIRDKNINWYDKFEIQAGDILLTIRGTAFRTTIVPDDYKKSFISSNLSIIRVNPKKYNPYVLLSYLQKNKLDFLFNLRKPTLLKTIQIPNYSFEFVQDLGEKIKNNKLNFITKQKQLRLDYEKEKNNLLTQV